MRNARDVHLAALAFAKLGQRGEVLELLDELIECFQRSKEAVIAARYEALHQMVLDDVNLSIVHDILEELFQEHDRKYMAERSDVEVVVISFAPSSFAKAEFN
jgi:hypothetical protein